jgi:hypothetical protein
MKNASSIVLFAFTVSVAFILTVSIAATFLSVITLVIGHFLILALSASRYKKQEISFIFTISLSVILLGVLVKWIGNIDNYINFSVSTNDQYKFFTESLNGEHASSIYSIFNDCIIDNIHWENGGYYFYIKTIAYLSKNYFDGNNLFVQQLASAIPAALSSIFIYLICSLYVDSKKTSKYTLLFVLLSPLCISSFNLHRDILIALFYFIVIYLWLSKPFSIKYLVTQCILALILFYLREQHGFFAIIFIFLSLYHSSTTKKWIYGLLISPLIIHFGMSLYDTILLNYSDTVGYYTQFREDALANIDSGIGRYVYQLPLGLKQLAQVIIIHLKFPPWLQITDANNVYETIIGCWNLVVRVFWFYVFSLVITHMSKKNWVKLPSKIKTSLIIYLLFIILSSSNLDERRTICVFPMLFIAYIYLKENILTIAQLQKFNERYTVCYILISFVYLAAKMAIG